jgi:hypothetical protein
MRNQHTDILIVGGGVGGCAAALAATSMGYKVVLTEETDWLGGQLTAQAVPPDESPWIESFGCTRRYRAFRDGIRQYYKDHFPLNPAARANPRLNPGGGFVSRLCHEPRVGVAVIESMMAYPRSRGLLSVLLDHKPIAVDMDGDTARAVTLEDVRDGTQTTVEASYILDATELGDLLPLGGIEYVTGAESRDDTGEMHAVDGPAQPENVQAITWCFPIAYDPDGEHVIDKPEQWEKWRDFVPDLNPTWAGRLLSFTDIHPTTLEPRNSVLLPEERTPEKKHSFWLYRRIVTQDHFETGAMPHEVTLVNWPMNDYWGINIIDKPQEVVRTALHEAKQLSRSLLYWLQTEYPRPDGGTGYPGLYLRPDMAGTADGFAKQPYIRESRRILAQFTVTEEHVGAQQRSEMGFETAAAFEDSVGIGSYRIDLHPSTGGDNYIDVSSLPFQIPLGALIPQRVENVLPACKNLGVTHITNGCYRLHPVEWNIGEAAGLLGAYCLKTGVRPAAVLHDTNRLADFQQLCDTQGIEREWPHTHAV